jgi:hypothetical protein
MEAVRPRGDVSAQAWRWSIERASGEFKLAANTLRKILNQGGAKPDAGGCYTTQQICQCLYGDLRAERLPKERELTRKYSVENQIVEANLLDRTALARVFATIADAFVSRVMSVQGLSRREKEDLLKDLATWPLALQEVADRQTKLPSSRRGNGQTLKEDGNED